MDLLRVPYVEIIVNAFHLVPAEVAAEYSLLWNTTLVSVFFYELREEYRYKMASRQQAFIAIRYGFEVQDLDYNLSIFFMLDILFSLTRLLELLWVTRGAVPYKSLLPPLSTTV